MKMKAKDVAIHKVENGMDYIIEKGWTFKRLSKGLLLILAVGLVVYSLSTGWAKEEPKETKNIAYAQELEPKKGKKVANVEEPKDEVVEVEDQVEVAGLTEGTENSTDKLNDLWKNNTKEEREFLTKVAEVALEVAKEYQVYPSIIVAQSVLESDWGKSELAVNANNYFGVKGAFNGESYAKRTKEDDGTGVQTEIIANFAKYPTMKESIESNAKLLRNGADFDENYYQGAWVENTTSYKEATLALTGTYATDIHYNTKVNTVIEHNNLEELDNLLYN